jgi:hypothetical protein
MNERIISIDKGAETLNCSVKYAKAQLRTGKWPGEKLAGRWAFAESDINSIIEMGSNRAPTIDDYVSKILAGAPPLNDEQRVRLAELLRPVRGVQ